jgi:ribosomal protein S18 acetylase RimI-like enzyme
LEGREIKLRTVQPEDQEFLYRVYASSREMELAAVPWDDAQKEQFLRMQFNAQDKYYHEYYSNAAYDVVLVDGEPAGRLYVDRWAEEIRVMDIALLPQYRNTGIGSTLLRRVMDEGAQSGKKVSIHVEQFNPALRLYERLGFKGKEQRGVYYLLEWTPESEGQPEA